MAKKDSELAVSPWSKRADKAVQGVKREGPLYQQANATKEVLEQASKSKLLSVDKQGYRFADTVKGHLKYDDGSKQDFSGCVALAKGTTGTIEVALNSERFYTVTDGYVINRDSQEPLDPDVDKDETERVRYILRETANKLDGRIREKRSRQEYRQAAIRHGLMITGIWVAVVGLVGGGITLGVFKWKIEPAREAAAYAAVYDAKGLNLPGEGAPVAAYPFEEISPEQFEAIPKLRRRDNSLDHPRRVTLGTDSGCTTIGIDVPKDVRLRAAMADGTNAYKANGYNVAKKGSSVTICLANYKPSSSQYGIPIAVQVVN